jgi:hypothetical protein
MTRRSTLVWRVGDKQNVPVRRWSSHTPAGGSRFFISVVRPQWLDSRWHSHISNLLKPMISHYEEWRTPTRDLDLNRALSLAKLRSEYTRADDITTKVNTLQRETYIGKGPSHWQSLVSDVPKPMISPQRMPIPNEKPTLKHSSLTGRVSFSMYQSR